MKGMKSAGLIAAVVAMACGLGCWKSDPNENKKPNEAPRIINIQLTPESARAGDPLYSKVTASDKEGDAYRVDYEWHVNDEIVEGESAEGFDTAGLKTGARVYVTVRAVENVSGVSGESKNSNVVVLDTAYGLELKGVSLEPAEIRAQDPARAVVDFGDTDPDAAGEVYYRWFVNSERVGEEGEDSGPELLPENFQRGDDIRVEVCTDGLFAEPHVWSSKNYRVQNSAPEFTSTPSLSLDGTELTVFGTARDGDGDRLTFSIKAPPPGAAVDITSEGIKLDLSKVPAGEYTINYAVSDGQGGEEVYSIGFTMPDLGGAPEEGGEEGAEGEEGSTSGPENY